MLIKCSTIISAAFPSQSFGIPPFFHFPAKSLSNAGFIADGLVPINSLVPISTVSGRVRYCRAG